MNNILLSKIFSIQSHFKFIVTPFLFKLKFMNYDWLCPYILQKQKNCIDFEHFLRMQNNFSLEVVIICMKNISRK